MATSVRPPVPRTWMATIRQYAGLAPAAPGLPDAALALQIWAKAAGSASETAERRAIFRLIQQTRVIKAGVLTVPGSLNLSGYKHVTCLPPGLRVGEHLLVNGCTALTHLPAGLRVGGRLALNGCTALTHLPTGLRVEDSLYLSGCAHLETLPERLWVGKTLDLSGCGALITLPHDMVIESLVLRDCGALRALPEGLHPRGDLDLSGCVNLVTLPQDLRIDKNLLLSNCRALRALPVSLKVGDSLYLNGCTALEGLPATVSLAGSLIMKGCSSLKALPAGLHVGRNLDLSHCSDLAQLPPQLHVGGSLDVSYCPALAVLPETLHIGADLKLRGCTGLVALPGALRVEGSLDVSGCTELTALPVNLKVGGTLIAAGAGLMALPATVEVDGNIDLSNCAALTTLPAGLHAQASLKLSGCIALQSLPPGLHIPGSLDVSDCPALTVLPEALWVGDTLNLSRCRALITVPAGVIAHINLLLDGCTALQALDGERLELTGKLVLAGCTALRRLPSTVQAGSDVSLAGCTTIQTLPDTLSCGGSLILTGCRALQALPAQLAVAQDVDASQCTILQEVPPQWLQWSPCLDGTAHHIDLQDTNMDAATCAHLQIWQHAQGTAGALRFSLPAAASMPAGASGFASLQDAWNYWHTPPAASTLVLDEAAQQLLCTFLQRLRHTAEAKGAATRPVLRQRIATLRDRLASGAWQPQALGMMHGALESCGDALIRGLDDLERAWHVQQATEPGAPAGALRLLGISLLKLHIVHQHAARAYAAAEGLDEVEVFLRFETQLADRLQLPVTTRTMLYHADVTAAQLEEAAIAAQTAAADPQQVEAYLNGWDVWQQRMRRDRADSCFWAALRPTSEPKSSWEDAVCPITLDPYSNLIEPILLADGSTVVQLGALKKWWVEHGTHPVTRQPLYFEGIQRLPQADTAVATE